ncbi:hypothetical protein IL306_011767 [Fusarium sp. DS 682]|nr:hypothetical protein IL306_011767 [Fusarium sp. DS 682]
MDATPEQVAIFESKQDVMRERMEHIIKALMSFKKSEQWENILKMKSVSEWATAILKLLPLRTWHILASDIPPGYKQYTSIPFIERFETVGVFARTYSRTIYVGLAEKPMGTLVLPSNLKHNRKPQTGEPPKKKPHRINKNESKGILIPLIPVPLADTRKLTYKEKVELRHVLGLAKAVLTAWLGAAHKDVSPAFQELYVWKDTAFQLPVGMGPCNPLEFDLRLPMTPAEHLARKENQRKLKQRASWKPEPIEIDDFETWASEVFKIRREM